MTPNHAIFRKIFEISDKTVATYDYMPDASANYPFCFVGEQLGNEELNIDLMGETTQTLHIYNLRKQRSVTDEIVANLTNALKTQNTAYDYHINFERIQPRFINDNTDTQPLMHVVLDVTYSYTKKGDL